MYLRHAGYEAEVARSGDDGLAGARRDPPALVVRGEMVTLTSAEYRILERLLRWPGRVFTRDELMDGEDALDRTVDVHIKNLRRKIEEDRAHPRRIVTVFGIGYKYVKTE